MEGFRGSETPAGSLLGAFRVSRQGCGARDGWVYRVYIGLFRQITAFLVYCLRGSSPEKLTFIVVFRLLMSHCLTCGFQSSAVLQAHVRKFYSP